MASPLLPCAQYKDKNGNLCLTPLSGMDLGELLDGQKEVAEVLANKFAIRAENGKILSLATVVPIEDSDKIVRFAVITKEIMRTIVCLAPKIVSAKSKIAEHEAYLAERRGERAPTNGQEKTTTKAATAK